nr:2574_t:CDS:2 [Entrophospora candida]
MIPILACCESHPTFPTSPKVEVPYYPSIARVLVNNANNQGVRESVYDAELYQIMSNWLDRFRVTGQWHLKYCASGHINNKYVDIVISRSDHPKIVFELLATATKKELKEHYERALIYDKKLPADETWIVHFTCEANAISEPCWPTKSQLEKDLRILYFWHDLSFTKTRMTSCWWDANNNTRHVSDVEEFMVRYIMNISLIASFTSHVSNDLCSIAGFVIVRIVSEEQISCICFSSLS